MKLTKEQLVDKAWFGATIDADKISVDLPDDIVDDGAIGFNCLGRQVIRAAHYLYGDDPTEEQIADAAMLLMIAVRKRVGEETDLKEDLE